MARQARAVLSGRETECARLDQLLAEAHEGQSAVLVLRSDWVDAEVSSTPDVVLDPRTSSTRTRPWTAPGLDDTSCLV